MTGQDAGQLRNCISCHDPHSVIKAADRQGKRVEDEEPSRFSADDSRCMACHDEHADFRERRAPLCLYCHADGKTDAQVATGRVSTLIDGAAYSRTPHAIVACATCHSRAAAYGHAHQAEGNCLRCHNPHYAQARDPHVNVECRACHVSGGRMALADHRVVRERVAGAGLAAQTHGMVRCPSRQACERCHFDGNRLGASALVLPAKSILCVGCHAATLSVNDAVTIPSLVVFGRHPRDCYRDCAEDQSETYGELSGYACVFCNNNSKLLGAVNRQISPAGLLF
jgi:hypothetical protein